MAEGRLRAAFLIIEDRVAQRRRRVQLQRTSSNMDGKLKPECVAVWFFLRQGIAVVFHRKPSMFAEWESQLRSQRQVSSAEPALENRSVEGIVRGLLVEIPVETPSHFL